MRIDPRSYTCSF